MNPAHLPPASVWSGWDEDDEDDLLVAPAHVFAERALPPEKRQALSKRRRALQLAAGSLAVLVAVAGLGAGFLYWKAQTAVGQFQAGAKRQVVEAARPQLAIQPAHPIDQSLPPNFLAVDAKARADGKAQTILLVGSDQRWGESDRGRSDTILLLRVDPADRAASLLSIPRDLKVPIPGHGYDKVNAAYSYGGVPLLIATLREYFGIKIDHFFEVGMRGFGDMVTSLGGVYVPVDQRYHVPPNAGFMQIDLQPGYQLLRRSDALSFVRFRHYDSDFVRAARQQLFLREVKRQVEAHKYDFSAMSGLLNAFTHATTSDYNSLGGLWNLLSAMRSIPPDRISRFTVPATGGLENGIYYLESASSERDQVMAQWYHPASHLHAQAATAAQISRASHRVRRSQPATPAAAAVVSDGGAGRTLLASLHQRMALCAPTDLPSGFYWPDASQSPARAYQLGRYPAVAAYQTAGSGRSALWMWTTWQNPPILDNPTRTVRRAGRALELYFESGKLHQVAWHQGSTRAWLTNTLQNDLSSEQMLALADSCAPLPRG